MVDRKESHFLMLLMSDMMKMGVTGVVGVGQSLLMH
jgi:hypothetical protein